MIEKVQSAIRSIVSRPRAALEQISAGGAMAIITAAGFLPLFPAVGTAFHLDPLAAVWLGSIGTNILANWVQGFYDHARQNPPGDEQILLQRLAQAIESSMTEENFRRDLDLFFNRVEAIQAAQSALQANTAQSEWLLLSIETELAQYRQDFSATFSRVTDLLNSLGYKTDLILENTDALRKIVLQSSITTQQQLEEIRSLLEALASKKLTEVPEWPPNLPASDPYYFLPHREARLKEILATLRDPQGRSIIAIDGLGGLGKTALAVEIGKRALREQLCVRILGESAKQQRLIGEQIQETPSATLSYDALLNSIARQLGRWDIPTLTPDQKAATIRFLLQQEHYLVIVDNLETAEDARTLVLHLKDLVGSSRAIVTSRPQLELDFVYALSLRGLEPGDALLFLREEAQGRNRPEILNASDADLGRIHGVTGGAPLALKLVVGQSSALPLDKVLGNLEQAKGDIYRFIYQESWDLLSAEAQKLLIYMGTVETTCSYQELSGAEVAENEDSLQIAIKEATRLSLLSPVPVSNGMRYSIHALTRHFVNSDLPDIWKDQGLL